jgi:hypothetical protein
MNKFKPCNRSADFVFLKYNHERLAKTIIKNGKQLPSRAILTHTVGKIMNVHSLQ